MTAFDFRTATSYAAALAVTVWSGAMLIAAATAPSVATFAQSVA